MVVRDNSAMDVFPIRPVAVAEAVKRAIHATISQP
jgi:hypothetical protein